MEKYQALKNYYIRLYISGEISLKKCERLLLIIDEAK